MCDKGIAIAVGTFDGVHLGHRLLLKHLKEESQRRGLDAAVVTFSSHPLATLRPDRIPPSLSTRVLRDTLLREAGVRQIIELPFTRNLAQLTARNFLGKLVEKYGVRHLVIGHNTSMGSDRLTGYEAFSEVGRELGISVSEAPKLDIEPYSDVSSSMIRRLIAKGMVGDAARLLGRIYEMEGKVVHGQELGRRLGYPTANLQPEPTTQAVPGAGVYACMAEVPGLGKIEAMVNIGVRPTIDPANKVSTIEAHLLGCNAMLYGSKMRLLFAGRLREERRFGSLEELRGQLACDAHDAGEMLRKFRS